MSRNTGSQSPVAALWRLRPYLRQLVVMAAAAIAMQGCLFEHMPRLPVSFHESYTSGRVISRQTSDVGAISELFHEGLAGLITAVLSRVLVGTGMLRSSGPLAWWSCRGSSP